MLIQFLLENRDGKTEYKVFGNKIENKIIFKDKSMPNTTMTIILNERSISIERTGTVQMKQDFILNKKTKGYYKSADGIEIDIYSKAKILQIFDDEIYVLYDYFVEEDMLSTNKLIIKY